jgi:S1-C subfamily serine protease
MVAAAAFPPNQENGPARTRPAHRLSAALCAAAVLGATACSASGSPPAAGPVAIPPGGGEQLQATYVRVATQALPSIVEISTGTGLGTGVVFDAAGHVLTNAHVVGDASTFQVRPSSGTATYSATLVSSWLPDDIAVIKVDGAPELRPATFARSADLEVGDIVLAMGNPFGLDSSVTDGVVSAVGRTVPEPAGPTTPGTVLRDAIQTSAPINPGNSGGALVNLDGEVVGIPTLAATNPEAGGAAPGIGFAIPSDLATDLARQIVADGRVVESHRAALGLAAVTVTDNDGHPAGVGVTRVEPGGAAAAAGIRDGDVITAIDGTQVEQVQQLLALLAAHRPGDVVQVTFRRPPDAASTVPVVLGELPGG